MKKVIPAELFRLVEKINKPVYVVGGAVRNYIAEMHRPDCDFDICGSFGAEIFSQIEGVKITGINKRMGTCQIKIGNGVFEYTRFRREYYAGGKHEPERVEFHESVEEDAARRDFTCNCVYYDVSADRLIDICGGVDDIKKKIIRTVGENTFFSDGLRILRAIRFAAELGFEIESGSKELLMRQAGLLRDISPERKRDEFNKILLADTKYGVEEAHYTGLKLLYECGVFPYIIPEICDLDGVKQNARYHKYDVLWHTFEAVRHARPDIRLAALLHDFGKPGSIDSEGHMKGHNVLSEKIARIVLGQGRLNYSNKIIDETAKLCFLHMYDLKGEASDAKMRVFVAENFDIIDKIAALRCADGKATGMENNVKFNRFLEFKKRLIDENAPISIKDLKIKGNFLEKLNVFPEKRGEILKELWRNCIIDPSLNNEEWLCRMAEKLACGQCENG